MHASLSDFPSQLFTPKLHRAVCIFFLILGLSFSIFASPSRNDADAEPESGAASAITVALGNYDWNLKHEGQPLLSLPAQINSPLELSLTYPMGQVRFPLFQELQFNSQSNRYIVQVLSKSSGLSQRVELAKVDNSARYVSVDGRDLYLTDNKGVKAIRNTEGTEYTFVRFTDGVDRCIRIKTAADAMITLIYAKDNLIRGLVDSSGRALRFNYENQQLASVSQSWTVNSVPFIKTWAISSRQNQVKLAMLPLAQ